MSREPFSVPLPETVQARVNAEWEKAVADGAPQFHAQQGMAHMPPKLFVKTDSPKPSPEFDERLADAGKPPVTDTDVKRICDEVAADFQARLDVAKVAAIKALNEREDERRARAFPDLDTLPKIAPVPLKAGDLAYVRSRIARMAAFVEEDSRAGVVVDRELVLLLNRHLRSLP